MCTIERERSSTLLESKSLTRSEYQEKIGWFDISMNDACVVDRFQCFEHFFPVIAYFGWSEAIFLDLKLKKKPPVKCKM